MAAAGWTPEQRAAYAERMRQRWAAGEFSRPGSRGDPNRRWRWMPAELDLLRKHAGHVPLWRLVELVNAISRVERSALAVRYRLHRLGLSAWMPVETSLPAVAAKLGQSTSTVHTWIAAGRLRATRAGAGQAGKGVNLVIDPADVQAMLRADPWLIDPPQISEPSWRVLVEVERRVQRRREVDIEPVGLTVIEAARRAGFSRWTLGAAIRAGELPARRAPSPIGCHGYRYLVDPADLQQWLGRRQARTVAA